MPHNSIRFVWTCMCVFGYPSPWGIKEKLGDFVESQLDTDLASKRIYFVDDHQVSWLLSQVQSIQAWLRGIRALYILSCLRLFGDLVGRKSPFLLWVISYLFVQTKLFSLLFIGFFFILSWRDRMSFYWWTNFCINIIVFLSSIKYFDGVDLWRSRCLQQ